jgi:hypothetical protein
MRSSLVALVVASALLPATAFGQAPHEHGHGTVTIVFEGDRLAIELIAPGADIVGFERPPQSPAEETALAAATALFKDPSTLIELPGTARCTVSEAELTVEGYTQPAAGGPAPAHTEFEGAYVFTCADVSAIRVIAFPFFARFPNSEELDVTVVTARGPTTYEVTRAEPNLDRGNPLWRWLTGR